MKKNYNEKFKEDSCKHYLGANIVAPITAQAATTINIGDYVHMGSYYGEPNFIEGWFCGNSIRYF